MDKAGTTVSWACAIHCLAMPLVISFLPLLGISFIAHEGFEYVFIGFSFCIAAFSLLPGYFKQHGKMRTLLLFISGISFVILADIIFPESLFGKMVFVIFGAGMITTSHVLNRRLCRDCAKCEKTANR